MSKKKPDPGQLLMFSLRYCPPCRRALQLLEQVKKDQPELAEIVIRVVDERKERKLAAKYDYYHVPTFFLGQEKLSEGAVTYEQVKTILEYARNQTKES